MAITHEIIEKYENYGRCVKISNGIIEAYVTIDVGPRIIRFAHCNGDNIFYNDIERKSNRNGEKYDEYYYESATWYIYGGHRLWLTPESSPETYYPDNEEVKYEITDNGAIFTPNEQIGNKVQLQIEVQMSDNAPDMKVIHRVKNTNNVNRQCSLWGISVLNGGGLEIIPQNTHDTGLLANRIISLWPYSNVTDDRFYFGNEYITVRQDKNADGPFKLGTDNQNGFAAYVLGDDVFVCHFDYKDGVTYPDNNVNFETYTDKNILELESLSQIYDLAPGESAESIENWSLYKANGTPDARNEAEIKEFLNNLK